MVDKQLEEQLERMRRLNEQLAEMQRNVTENNELIRNDRHAGRGGPLSAIRDFRTYQSPDYDDFRHDERNQARPEGGAGIVRRRRRR